MSHVMILDTLIKDNHEALKHKFQDLSSGCSGMQDELYLEGLSVLVDVLCTQRQYTKAEMLCRKMIEQRVNMFGTGSKGEVDNVLQLAAISVAQNLHDEGEERAEQVKLYIHHVQPAAGQPDPA